MPASIIIACSHILIAIADDIRISSVLGIAMIVAIVLNFPAAMMTFAGNVDNIGYGLVALKVIFGASRRH